MINQQLAEKLKILANHMLEVADEMWHYDIGDSAIDDLVLQHSTDLEGASKMVRDWSKEIAKIPSRAQHDQRQNA